MATFPTEQALRQEAIRRCLAGEIRTEICGALQRSPRWFDKWWATYRRDPQTDFADHSRAPQNSPQQWPSAVTQMIVSIRRAREAGRTPDTKYGFIGQRTIQADLERLGVNPPPQSGYHPAGLGRA